MASRRNDAWEADYEIYNEAQVESILDECGVEIEQETGSHFICLCPFHGNTDSPAFAIDKTQGLWTCFNPSCGRAGKLEDLPKLLLKLNIFQCKRMILKYQNASNKSLSERLAEAKKSFVLPSFSQETIDKMSRDFQDSAAEEYMRGRGFNDDTLEFFQVGYSKVKNTVAVPMYSIDGKPVGVIGRRLPPVDFKYRFENSKNLPKKEIPWNIHNAKKSGDTVIICEASFDAMRIHQAGYPNVIALLGGHGVSPWHHDVIDKMFSNIIIMTDFDKLRYDVNCAKCKKSGYRICNGHNDGRELGSSISTIFKHKKIMWAAYDDSCVYPTEPLEGVREKAAKDASDMTDDEIRKCLKGAISNFQYSLWNIEEALRSNV